MAKQKRRNFHAIHPIMRKGGVHEKSNGAKRKAARLATRKLVSESRCDAPVLRLFHWSQLL